MANAASNAAAAMTVIGRVDLGCRIVTFGRTSAFGDSGSTSWSASFGG